MIFSILAGLICYVCLFVQYWSNSAADAAAAYLSAGCSVHADHQSNSDYGQNLYMTTGTDVKAAFTVSIQ